MPTFQDIDRLINTLRMTLAGATDNAINLALFNVIDDHMRRTNAWRWDMNVDLTANTVNYPIFPPSGATLVRVLNAEHNGSALGQINTAEIVDPVGTILADVVAPSGDATFDADIESAPGGVFKYAVYFPSYIAINVPPTPEAIAFPLRFLVALTMDPQNLEEDPHDWTIPTWMFARYFQDWVDGTLSKMFSQPAKPWSNPQLAIYHGRCFNRNVAFAKQESDRGFSYNATSWKYPKQGGWV